MKAAARSLAAMMCLWEWERGGVGGGRSSRWPGPERQKVLVRLARRPACADGHALGCLECSPSRPDGRWSRAVTLPRLPTQSFRRAGRADRQEPSPGWHLAQGGSGPGRRGAPRASPGLRLRDGQVLAELARGGQHRCVVDQEEQGAQVVAYQAGHGGSRVPVLRSRLKHAWAQ